MVAVALGWGSGFHSIAHQYIDAQLFFLFKR